MIPKGMECMYVKSVYTRFEISPFFLTDWDRFILFQFGLSFFAHDTIFRDKLEEKNWIEHATNCTEKYLVLKIATRYNDA